MLFWRTKLYNGILNIHWKWLNMKYNIINSCHIRVALFLFSKFPIAWLHNFYNKNCKLRKYLRLQNIVGFSKIFKQIRQERGHSTTMKKILGGEVREELWVGSPLFPAALPLETAIRSPLSCATRIPTKVGRTNAQLPHAYEPCVPGEPQGTFGTYAWLGLMVRNVRITHEDQNDRLTVASQEQSLWEPHRQTGIL